MSSLQMERRRGPGASSADPQRWQRTKTTSMRTTNGDRNSFGQDLNRPSVTQQRLTNSTSSSLHLESEYIKQLQEQIYYLETECLYLRDQLNKNSIILDRSIKDDRLYQIERQRTDLQRSLIQTSSQFDQLSSEKHGLTIALDELRMKFDVEKQNLLDELEMLRRARETFDQEKHLRDQEIRQIRDRARASADDLKSAEAKIRLLEQQLDQQLGDNRNLKDELRHSRLETSDLQRSISEYELANRERDRLQDIVSELEKELTTVRLELKAQDARYNDAQFLRNQWNDEKGALMKELSRLENLNKELQRELDQSRFNLRERTEALQSKDKELAALRKKEQSYRSTVESMQLKLDSESSKGKDSDGKIKQLERQLNIEQQNAGTARRELNEYELRYTRLQEEINHLRREKDQLLGNVNLLKQQLTSEEESGNVLRIEIEKLEERVKEIDRLKSLEDLIQSQRWEDISQMAHTMQSVSRTMARATSPTTIRKRIEL